MSGLLGLELALMDITVNGEKIECCDGSSVMDLLKDLEIDISRVAVELNHNIIPKAQLMEKKVENNDNFEIVTFVGGG